VCDPIRRQHTFWRLHWGEKDQSTIKMSEDHSNNMTEGDPTDPFNPANIIHLTAMDQLLEDLHKLVEEKNAANLVAALASCSVDRHGGAVTQFKLVDLAAPSTTTAPKVIPPISDPSSMVTLEQLQKNDSGSGGRIYK
jgi:hypothetical protein